MNLGLTSQHERVNTSSISAAPPDPNMIDNAMFGFNSEPDKLHRYTVWTMSLVVNSTPGVAYDENRFTSTFPQLGCQVV